MRQEIIREPPENLVHGMGALTARVAKGQICKGGKKAAINTDCTYNTNPRPYDYRASMTWQWEKPRHQAYKICTNDDKKL